MSPIIDFSSYTREMRNAMKDKLFFTRKLPKGSYVFIDFGCADGTMIEELSKTYPGSEFIGYDCSKEMIQAAKERVPEGIFTTDWKEVEQSLSESGLKSVLVLSSVIHEVYSYSTGESEITKFWNRVFESDFDYIVIRDMMLPENIKNRRVSKQTRGKLLRHRSTQFLQFEEKYGKVNTAERLVHFLLKYRWTENWERELNENYLPITIDQLLEKVKETDYAIRYMKTFSVRFIHDKVLKDLEYNLRYKTHIKVILEK